MITNVKLVEFKGDTVCIQLHPHIYTAFNQKNNIKNKSSLIQLRIVHYR